MLLGHDHTLSSQAIRQSVSFLDSKLLFSFQKNNPMCACLTPPNPTRGKLWGLSSLKLPVAS